MNTAQSCQYLVSTAINSSMQFAYLSGGVMLIVLILRIAASIYKTKLSLMELEAKTVSAPSKLEAAAVKAGIGLRNIKAIKEDGALAASVGLIKPNIVISTKTIEQLKTDELSAVLLHEYFHAKWRHPLIMAAAGIVRKVLVVFPILQDGMDYLACKFECAADRFVIENQNTSRHLRSAMKLCLVENLGGQPSYFRNLGYEHLEDRIGAIQGGKITFKFSKIKLAVSLMSAIGMIGLLQLSPHQIAAQTMRQELELHGYHCSLVSCASGCIQHPQSIVRWQSSVDTR